MTRWLILTLALGCLALGAWALFTTRGDAGPEIDAESRAALEQVLQDTGEDAP